jgi:hypothetical protein
MSGWIAPPDFEEMAAKTNLIVVGRGFSSRIAFSTTTRFVQARANSLNTPFSLAQSSILATQTPFRLLVICREQERKLIKTIQILVKNLAKIFGSRVLIFTVSAI